MEKMVELDERALNQLFQTLSDWNEQLKTAEHIIYGDEPGAPAP